MPWHIYVYGTSYTPCTIYCICMYIRVCMYFFHSFLARLKLTASKFRCQPVWCASFDCLHCVLRLRRFPFSLLMWHRWKYHVPPSDVIPLPVPLSLFPLYRSPSWAELKEPRNCMLCCRSRTILHTLLMDMYTRVCVSILCLRVNVFTRFQSKLWQW